MIKKEYFPPQAEEMLLKMEGPLCYSGEGEDLPDYDVVTPSFVWD